MIYSQQQRFAGLSREAAQRAVAVAQAMQNRRIDEAERNVIGALALAPKHPEILHLYARVECVRGRFDKGIEALAQALAARPDDAAILLDLASAYEALRDYPRASEALRRACEAAPEVPACWYAYGRRLQTDGDRGAAIEALRRCVALAPNHAGARTLLANILETDGRIDEAAAEYCRVANSGEPNTGGAWWSLAIQRPMPLDDDDMATMQRLLRNPALTDSDRAGIGFALAIVYESRGNYERAFREMQAAHAIAKKFEPFDARAFRRDIDAILAAFDGRNAVSAKAQGEEAIFIMSLPRSGSTLIEQILASHSQVEGSEELFDFPQLMMEESDRCRQSFFDWAKTHTSAQWEMLGQEYLRRTAKWRTHKPRFTDKSLGNWRYVGAILSALPNARIVIARRDPLETMLGCYRYITARHPYVHDVEDLAEYWRDFDRSIAHWQKLYPGRIREQSYEKLVADPEGEIRALLDYCGLPFEAACLNFHQTTRRINTMSAAQVREPLRKDTSRAAKYGALLDPMRLALGLPRFQSA